MEYAKDSRMIACLLVLAAGLSACDDSSSSGGSCAQGSERCACYGNSTCDDGLTCLSDICVSTSGGGGSAGGGAGNESEGGTSGGSNNEGLGGGSTGDTSGGNASVGGNAAVGGNPSAGGTPSTSTTSSTQVTSANLIKNGDFALGKEYWDLTLNDGDIGSASYSTGRYCVTNLSGSYFLSFSLGYPPTSSDAFVIEPGVTYKISYYMSGSGASAITVKIGHAISPYTAVFQATDYATSLGSVQSHTFSSTAGDTAAGLVFNGTLDYYANVCFDDVRVEKN